MEQLSKAIGLIKLLNEKGRITSADVANEFGVSIRTAQRYLQEITRTLPVQSEEFGKNKYIYSLMENYSFKDSIINSSEISILSALLDHAKSVLGKEKSEFLDILKKKIFFINTHCQSYHILEKQSIDFKKISKTNEKLNEAINKKSIIEISYEKTKKTYKLEPHKILYWEGFWYLVAKHENIIKKFLLDYISSIKITNKRFNKLSEDINNTLNKANNIWFEEKKDKVKIEIKEKLANYFKRKQILNNQKIIEEKKNGNIVIEFEVSNERDLFHQIIIWLPYFKILSPDKYLKFIDNEIKQYLEK